MNDSNLPPTNLDAEEAILGGILLDPKAIDVVADILPVEAFSMFSFLLRCLESS